MVSNQVFTLRKGRRFVKRSFVPLFATNFFGVVNDNFLKGRATSPSFGPTLIKSVLLWLFVAPDRSMSLCHRGTMTHGTVLS